MLLPQYIVGKNDVVVKKTISPATAGKAVTFSSAPRPSVFARSICAVFEPLPPLSRMTSSEYDWLTPFDGSRSLPVPWNRYCCVPPTVTDAIDPNIGWLAPASYSLIGEPVTIFGAPDVIVMSNRHSRPSRSPTYALVM